MSTAAGRVHSRLGLTDTKHRDQAITLLNQALADDSDGRGRQRAFNHAWLATCVLADGDPTSGAHLGNQALDVARDLTSPRLLGQLAHELRLLRTSG